MECRTINLLPISCCGSPVASLFVSSRPLLGIDENRTDDLLQSRTIYLLLTAPSPSPVKGEDANDVFYRDSWADACLLT